MIGISHDQEFEYFKEFFLNKENSQLLEIDDINAAIVKPRVFILLFKVKLPQAYISSTLVHVKGMLDDTPQNAPNQVKLLRLLKHWNNSRGLTRITSKPNPSIRTKKNVKRLISNGHSFNKRSLWKGK